MEVGQSALDHGFDEEGAVGGTHAVVQAARHVEHRFRHVEMAVGQAAALPQRSQPELTGVMDQPLGIGERRSEEHTSELQSLMRSSYAVFCLQKNRQINT